MSADKPKPSDKQRPSDKSSKSDKPKPSFNYDLEVFKLCQKFIKEKNHHGLALIARQKGLPPFLRYKIWPILLKYHPYVIKPSIQPDNIKDPSKSGTDLSTDELLAKIEKDLNKYLIRLKYTTQQLDLNPDELEVFDILKHSVHKFIMKWGKIIKYDSALTWIALGLAEWYPPIPNTSWVLVGRDLPKSNESPSNGSPSNGSPSNGSPSNGSEQKRESIESQSPKSEESESPKEQKSPKTKEYTVIKNIFSDYSNYIDNLNLSDEEFSDNTSLTNSTVSDQSTGSGVVFDPAEIEDTNMSFHEVFERLVLVLLHCPNHKLKQDKDFKKLEMNNEKFYNLPKNGGSIEERVTFFIFLFRKLLPELSSYFNEEQILNKFGSNDDEWLIWWLKYCGSKVWSRLDRGKIWDLLIGFKFKSKDKNYNTSVVHLSESQLMKIGNDNFWSFSSSSLADHSSSSLMDLSNLSLENDYDIPFPKVNPHIQLIFITLALLKSKENVLVELDQHEIRQYLSRLPSNSYNLSNKYQIFKQKIDKKREEQRQQSTKNSRSSTVSDLSDLKSLPNSPLSHNSTATSFSTSPTFGSDNHIISNDSLNNHSIDFMDNIIHEAGELWRRWLWLENN